MGESTRLSESIRVDSDLFCIYFMIFLYIELKFVSVNIFVRFELESFLFSYFIVLRVIQVCFGLGYQ